MTIDKKGALPSGAQIVAARALLDWSGERLARESGVSLSTIRRIEDGASPSLPVVRKSVVDALERNGVKFVTDFDKCVLGVTLHMAEMQ